MQGKVQSQIYFFLGMVTLSWAVIDLYEPEVKLNVAEGENVDLMCRTSASKYSYCTFSHPNNVSWIKFKFDDASQTVKELKRKWLDNIEYTGNNKECQLTLKNVEGGKEGHSGKWKCKVEDWETEDQEEATGTVDEKVLDVEVTSVMKIKQFKTIQKGDSIRFKCLGNQAFGKCKIQNGDDFCIVNDKGVIMNGRDEVSDGVASLCSRLTLKNTIPERCLVTITDLTKDDSGDWTCELDDVASQPMHLKVNLELANQKLERIGTSSAVIGPQIFVQSKFTLHIFIVGMYMVAIAL